jgi:toxin ParE1/3/4
LKANIVITPEADRDLDEEFAYLARQNIRVAGRFLDVAHQSFSNLAQMPGMGSLAEFKHPRLSDVRMWPIPGFEKHLIFYRPTEAGIEVIRVLHAGRHIKAIFESE